MQKSRFTLWVKRLFFVIIIRSLCGTLSRSAFQKRRKVFVGGENDDNAYQCLCKGERHIEYQQAVKDAVNARVDSLICSLGMKL